MKRFITLSLFSISILFSFTMLAQQKKEIEITTSSEEALSFFLEGRHKYENIQYATAAALFDEAIITDPEFAMAYLYRSRSGGGYNVERQNLEKAVSLIDKVTEGEKNTILFYKAFAEGNDAKQKEHIDFLLKSFPKDKRTHFNAGIYFDFITDYPNALKHYIIATQIDEDYAAAYNKIGYCFFDLEYYKAAEEAFQHYISLNPDSPNPYDSYAELLMKTGRYEESIEQYKNAYKKELLFTSALSGIGNNYLFMGDYKNAREYYQKHFRKTALLDEKIDALRFEAISYIHENNVQKGLETFTQLRILAEKENLITDAIEADLSSAFLCIEFNRPKKAEEYLKRSEEISKMSELPAAVKDNYLTQVNRFQCLYLIRNNELDKAENEIAKFGVLVNRRNNPLEIKEYFSLMGLLELEKENYEAALKYFDEADRDDPFNWYYMAKAYQKLGYLETTTELIIKISNWNENNLSYSIVKLHLKK